jgi:hypothetical protein
MARREVWKGALAGAAAGLAATVAMTQFQNLWSTISKKLNSKQSNGTSSQGESDDATMKVAGKVAESAGYSLTREDKKKAGSLVHYGFGTAMGALYGTMVELGPRDLRRRAYLTGLGFGGALFAGADEIAVPYLGLGPKPNETPVSSHLYGLASHLVYGVTAGTVRKAIRAAL